LKEEEHEQTEVLPAPGHQTGLRVDNDKRTTTPYMTKYERARVLGTRALQIASVIFALCLVAVDTYFVLSFHLFQAVKYISLV